MVNRIFCLLVAGIIGCSVETLAITRSLSQIHTPRALTLGMLIATSFMPYLKEEIKRVLEAMKTRGAGSVFNPKVFYRAFIVPLIMRLVSLSDTLSLSIETRCFSINREDKYTIYKKEIFGFIDLVFVLLVGCGALMVVIL
jgi:energy-coupling factor transport system permease protein